jgi:membrane peptidoglycan carboxypeptidase
VYRAQPRRIRPTNGHHRSNGTLRRIALARVRAKPRPKSHAGLFASIALLTLLALAGAGVASVVAGGAAGIALLDSMGNDLPDVSRFEDLDFAQPSNVYDRTGTVLLARFQVERRRVVSFEEIPDKVLDATIAVEDRTFWENEGYDPNAIVAAVIENLTGSSQRGASTITQQLVRARLLPDEVVSGDQQVRKIKEILQARRLTLAFPGREGKERIITAYLNQIYYGHNAYGIAGAAEVYFGIRDLSELTVAQAALLAGLPQAPNSYDLFKWAEPDADGRLVVPTEASEGASLPPPIERRNYILRNLSQLTADQASGPHLTADELTAALHEPVVVTAEEPLLYKAPHFVWHMKQQLDRLLADRAPAERGGYRIITTLDYDAQQIAERYVKAATIDVQLPKDEFNEVVEEKGLEQDRDWLELLRGKELHNGALLAMDARTGDILGYVGSADYYRDDLESDRLDPKFDVVGRGYRQPGSAWKPVEYAAGFDERAVTPGTLLLDVTTEFARGWVPRDADLLDRGPVLMRDALGYSLNTPTIRALDRIGVPAVDELAKRLGLTFQRGDRHLLQAGLAGAIGTVETNMLQLTAAYGAFANGGVYVEPRSILEIRDSTGELVYQAGAPVTREVLSPQAAWLLTDILKNTTDPNVNLVFGDRLKVTNGPDGERRPAAVKTGTTNDFRDLSTYGYLAPPADPAAPQIVASAWVGNSDHSPPRGDFPLIAADAPGRIWQSFLRDYARDLPLATFPDPPRGIVSHTIDAWSGGSPGPWTRETREEWFIKGTQPGGSDEVDQAGILYRSMCDGWYVDITQAEAEAPARWQAADEDWMNRARRGVWTRGDQRTRTAYLFGHSDWGGPIAPTACPTPSPVPTPGEPTGDDANPPGKPTPPPEATAPPENPKPTKPPKPNRSGSSRGSG